MEVISVRGIRFASNLGFGPILATKNFLQSTCFMRCTDPRRWKFKLSEKQSHYRSLSCSFVPFLNRINVQQVPLKYKFNKNILITRYCQSKSNKDAGKNCTEAQPVENLSVFAKMKQMTKDYWHVLVPVHIITSLGWVALFYIVIKNGLDIIKIMEYLNLNEKYLKMAQNSSAGSWALVYVLYKIFTPLRYTITIGFTTMAIRQLSKSGLVKPLPFGKRAQAMYKTTESNKATTTTHKTQLKVERQTEPPKT